MKAAILLYPARNFIGRRIATFWFPDGGYAHAAWVQWPDDKPAFTHGQLLESVFGKGILPPRGLSTDDLNALWMVPNEGLLGAEWVTEWEARGAEQAWAFDLKQVGKEYADRQLVRTFVFRRNLDEEERQRERKTNEVWWCSEYTFAIAQAGGWCLFAETAPHVVPPDMIRRSPVARRLAGGEWLRTVVP